jgi:TIGR03009 family protein
MPRSLTLLISPCVALLAMGFALAFAQETAPRQAATGNPRAAQAGQAAPRPDPARMEELLTLWAGQSSKLKTLEVEIYRIDRDEAWGEEEHYVGHAAFQTPDSAYLDYRKVKLEVKPDPDDKKKQIVVPMKKGNKLVATPHETIVCGGTEIWHYQYPTKQITVWTLDKDTKKRALEEGPLPFLFNMNAAQAKRRYHMTLRSEDTNRYLVVLQPLLPEDKEMFSSAWLSLDKKWLLPTSIVLISSDKKSRQDFVLSGFKANGPVLARFFQGIDPGKPWKVERNPGRDAQGAEKVRKPRRGGDPQSARRPAAPDADQPR